MKMIGADVTAEDIARRKGFGPCMIESALERVIGPVGVGWTMLNIYRDESKNYSDIVARIKLPAFVAARITDWECGRPVKPFSFVVVIP